MFDKRSAAVNAQRLSCIFYGAIIDGYEYFLYSWIYSAPFKTFFGGGGRTSHYRDGILPVNLNFFPGGMLASFPG